MLAGAQDAEFHLVAALREDFDAHVRSDVQRFADATGQDEHEGSSVLG